MKINAYFEFCGNLDVDIPNGENMTEDEIEKYLYGCLPTDPENTTIYSAYKILENGQEEAIFEY